MKRFVICHLSFVILILGCMALTSCRNDIVYSQFQSIPSGEWAVDMQPRFDFSIEDANTDYRVLLYVRHTERYPYQNMWVFLDNGTHRDTLEFYLADDRGNWLGDKHHGFIEMPVLIEQNYHFRDTGAYYLEVTHAMRDSVLRGVTDIGFEISKSRGLE